MNLNLENNAIPNKVGALQPVESLIKMVGVVLMFFTWNLIVIDVVMER